MFIKTLLTSALVASIPLALASPTAMPKEDSPKLVSRQSATTCGSTSYSASQVSAAVSAGCSYYESGETVGSNDYPHTYNNYEGFDFAVSGTYQEWPLLTSGTYSGGSPGADRVVFNTNCQWAGTITHTGASGNNFVGCTGTS
ncbi:guanyl-specific ribonuclease F1 [Phyllosticta capitalensis]|uniref:ribonuclease T1 n=2 Tax=Phyllosticta capitalensis TaxID=121624 RepID=A0ABR1Z5C9_9PEZI